MFLPLFWDATIHWYHAKVLVNQWWRYLEADYPWLYYYIVNVLWVMVGERAYNFIIYIWILLILVYSYLLSYRLTKNKSIGLLVLIIVGFSSKLIFYSARLYQEILITAFFLLSFYILIITFHGSQKKQTFLLAFLIWITLSIKQQWLFILYWSIALYSIILLFTKRIDFQKNLILLIVPLIIWIWSYWVLFHNKWRIIIWNEDYKVVNVINYLWQNLFSYRWTDYALKDFKTAYEYDEYIKNNQFNKIARSDLEEDLLRISDKFYDKWTRNAQNRQIQFSDIFTDIDKFNNAHNFFNSALWYAGYSSLRDFLFLLLILSLFYITVNARQVARKYKYILLYLVIFLWINYFFFQRNTDQARYHLFIPFYLLFFLSLFLKIVCSSRFSTYTYTVMLFIIWIWAAIPFYEQNRWAIGSQIYRPSKWWIASIAETGKWINENLVDDSIFQMCWNEIWYYSGKKTIWDWRIYFLNERDLSSYLRQNNISYFVLMKSQLVEDEDWKNLCSVPRSFVNKLNIIWKEAYASSMQDIVVYKIHNTDADTNY